MSGVNILDKRELLLEYTKCAQDPAYVIEKYFETFDKTQEGFVPFHLFDKQKTLIRNYQENRFNLVLKYRQAGISTVTAAYAAVLTAFALSENPQKVLILANKQETAIEFQKKIIDFIQQLPKWVGITFDKSAQKHVRLSNGSEIKSVATSPDALRGYTPTLMILDEAAFIEGGQSLWSACLAAIGTGGKATLISTPNGLDEIYYEAYEGAVTNTNKFKITHLKWWQDPRFNKDFRLIKTNNIVDWIQKPESEKTEQVIESCIDLHVDVILKFIEDGFKPHSTWYENMCRDMNLNKRMINQELECAFIGSGDNVIEGAIIRKQEETNVKQPGFKDKEWESNLWVWEMPLKGHRYIAALDVSRGDSEDATGYCIIDYDTFEQVLEYHGKVPPDIAAIMVEHYSKLYNAITTVDITGGMGIAATNKLKELGFPKKLLHYDNLSEQDMFFTPDDSAIPGINFASKNRRSQIVAALEEAVSRGDFKIRSERLITELKKFIYKNGKPDHMKGSHDDLIMALGMCLFVANTSFKRLAEADNMTKAMLDSWKVRENSGQSKSNYLLQDTINTRPEKDRIYNPVNKLESNTNLQNTRDFSWLFGNISKR